MTENLTPLGRAIAGLSEPEEKSAGCKNCGKPFRPRNDQQQHCTANCRKQYNKKGKVGHKVEAMIRSVVREEVKSAVPYFQEIVDQALKVIRGQGQGGAAL